MNGFYLCPGFVLAEQLLLIEAGVEKVSRALLWSQIYNLPECFLFALSS